MPWFRQASTADVHILLGRTLVQIITFWGLFLYVLPPRIARLGASLGIAPLYVHQASGLAATLFTYFLLLIEMLALLLVPAAKLQERLPVIPLRVHRRAAIGSEVPQETLHPWVTGCGFGV